MGERHLVRVVGKDEAADAKALVQSLKLHGNETPLLTTPDSGSVALRLYPDGPRAERARRAEAMRVLRSMQEEGIKDAVAHCTAALVARGWSPLARAEHDVATGKTRAALFVEAIREAGSDLGIIKRRIDDLEDRPWPTPAGPGADPQAPPGAPSSSSPPLDDAQRDAPPLLSPTQPLLARASASEAMVDDDMGDPPMAQPVL